MTRTDNNVQRTLTSNYVSKHVKVHVEVMFQTTEVVF